MQRGLTIIISTISENLNIFAERFNFVPLNDADEVIIVIQGKSDNEIINFLETKYVVIKEENNGLSSSRNIGISHETSDYIWFMDDDVLLYNDAIITVKNNISKYKAEIFTVRMENIKQDGPYKSYPTKLRLSRRNIINISSVEIIVSRKFIAQSKVTFNESLGLGTKYPSCEENIFLLDLFDLGAEMIHIPIYVQKHPKIDRTKLFTNPNILFAKGVFCKRYNGFMGIILMFLWICKSLICGANFKDSFNLVYGYKSADNILE